MHTDHGDEPIEKIEVGDKVLARNSKTGKDEYEPITALTPLHKGSLLEIRVEGERDPLRPSMGHPFWARRGDAADGQWIEAEKLRLGDLLQTADGNWRRITSISPVEQEETVYNFTVDQDHDYFVGNTGFLVHNAGNCGCGFGKENHHMVPQNAPGYGPAKQALANGGIGINDSENILPIDYFYHRRIHTNVYRNWINNTLTNAPQTKQGITCALQDIGNQILGGTAPF